ncbi:DNA damage-regulated autophagy modulator protein 1-like protein [Dinothrombium tinctorium]|uniref:DNA damage-regulated autophagy modulator protein 1-like protein n=1 Tax=Dinothrombium tinctorium TaxID=1965070 RepID=A0A443QJ17_9ACAR|nr:DNA damage-regulated autophagy modulator protein 1-like protein [Dinothrombium tinctorium]
MPWFSVHYLPLSVFVLLPSTFLITYIISIVLLHTEVEFPYISDTGTKMPESSIFSQMLNIVSFLAVLTLYVRYKQIEQYYRDHLSTESALTLTRNWICFCFGVISCFGLSIVANFQETNVFVVHMTGLYKMIIETLFMGPYAFHYLKPGKDPRNWQPGDGGYKYHVISSTCEWIAAMCLDFFILTFVREMHRISISSPRIIIMIDNLNLPSSGDGTYFQSDDVEIVRSDRRSVDSSTNRDKSDINNFASSSSQPIIH